MSVHRDPAPKATKIPSSGEGLIYDVPLLADDGKNFQTWKFRTKTILDIRALWAIVAGTEARPVDTTDLETLEDWIFRDKEAFAQITLTLSDEPLKGVLNAKNAKDAWDMLNVRYEGTGKQTIACLMSELFRGTLSDESALEPQLNAMRQKGHTLSSLGQSLGDPLIAVAMIISLPPSYATLRTILMSTQDKLSTDTVVAQILTEERSRRESNPEIAPFAEASKSKQKPKAGGDGKKVKKCDYCKRKGHVKDECRKLKADTAEEKAGVLTAQVATVAPMPPPIYNFSIQLLLIGDSAVGKSCLLSRFCDDAWTPSCFATTGMDFKIRTIELDGKRIKLQIWDTSGRERFRTITTAYYRGAMGILLVYDVTDERSFNNIRTWHSSIEQHASEGVNKILIGNKSDWTGKRVVTEEQGRKLANELGIKFMETSAKVNDGVEEAFFTLARDTIYQDPAN